MKHIPTLRSLLVALFSLAIVQTGWGQLNIPTPNTFVTTSWDGWNGTAPTGFTQSGIYKSTTASSTGGTYAIANSGLGWQPSGSATSLSVVGTFKNTTGSTQTSVTIEYDAFQIVNRTSRTPGWAVTSTLGNVSALNWTFDSSKSAASPAVQTVTLTGLNIPNDGTLTVTWASGRGDGSNSSPLIGLRNVKVRFNAATAPTVTTTTPATSVTVNSATAGGNITDTGGADATVRGIEYSTTNGFANGAGTQVTETPGPYGTGSFTRSLTGLIAGTTYYFKAFATNTAGTSYGGQQSFLTLPAAPATPTASAVGPTGFTVNWGSVTGASSYRLDVATDSGFTNLVAGYDDRTVAGTSEAVTGLAPETTYHARVHAVNATGTGANSGTLTQATNAAVNPTVTVTGSASALSTVVGSPSSSTSVSVTGVNLTANITATAPSSDFQVSSNDSSWGNTATFTQIGGNASGTLYIRLSAAAPVSSPSGNVALTSTGATKQNVAVTGSVLKAEPANHATGFAAGTITTSNIPAAWTAASPSPDGYLLKVSSSTIADPVDGTDPVDDTDVSDGSAQVKVTPGSATSYSGFTGFDADETYTFALFPYNNSGSGIDYKIASAPTFSDVLLPDAPATPTFAAVTSTGFTVNWGVVPGAADYRLDVATDSGFTSFVSGYNDLTVAGLSQAVTGLAANTTYHARVRAVNATGTSANSPTANQTTDNLPAPVTAAPTDIGSNGFTANWDAVSGATGYRLDVYSGGSSVVSDLIISQYVETDSGNFPKGIELWNVSGETIDFADTNLVVRKGTNGGALSDILTVSSGTLAAGGVIVLGSDADSSGPLAAHLIANAPGVTYIQDSDFNHNGDDAFQIVLDSVVQDTFGDPGTGDPGTEWSGSGVSTANSNISLKSPIIDGYIDGWTDPSQRFETTAAGTDLTGFGIAPDWLSTILVDDLDIGNFTTYVVTGASPETEYSYVVRATSATSTSADSDVRTVTTTALTPIIAVAPTSTAAFTTTYGTPSASQEFDVTGTDMTTDLVVTAPAGFEVSTDDAVWSTSVNYSPSSGSVTADLFVRLAGTAAAGAYNGLNVTLSSDGFANVTVEIPASTVAQKQLTITGASATGRAYNGTTTVAVSGGTLSGIEFGDDVTLDGSAATGSVESANVGGGKAVTVTGFALSGTAAANYTVAQPTGVTVTITQKALTVSGATATGRAYNGTTVVAVSGGALEGVVGSEDVSLVASPSGTLADANAGSNKSVDVTGFSISGTDAGNYSIAQPTGLTVDITAKGLTVSAPTLTSSKAYDGNTTAAVTAGTLSGVESGDTVTVSASAAYDNASVGTGKTITVTYTLGGASLANYSAPTNDEDTNGVITAKALTVTSAAASNKAYDGTTAATITGTLSGVVGSEDVALVGTGTFDSANVDTGIDVTSTSTLTGAAAGNYSLTQPTSLTANITSKALTGSFTASNKVYDGTTVATVATRAVSGVVGSDDVNHTGGTATFSDANAGDGKTVTLTDATLTGAAAGNYTLSSVSTTTANITKATPTITAAPTAIAITEGQALSASNLSGGTATGVGGGLDGTFAFTAPGTTPAVGTASQDVTFTPTDTANYNNATTSVSVRVNSGADPLFAADGESPTITIAPGVANIAFTGIPGRTYGIQRSTTLATDSWTEIDTVTADPETGATTYQDQNRVSPAAFYRVVYPPAAN